MGEDEDDDDGDDIQMILEKLRRSEEDQEDEATLREWMRTQQEAARKTWGVKGDMASLAQYRRRQLLRWGHAQHVFDDEMSDEWNEHQVCTPLLPPTRPHRAANPLMPTAIASATDTLPHQFLHLVAGGSTCRWPAARRNAAARVGGRTGLAVG